MSEPLVNCPQCGYYGSECECNSELESLRARVKELEEENSRLQEDCPQTWKAVADAHWDKVESLRSEVASLKEENGRLISEDSELRKKAVEMIQDIKAEYLKERQDLESQLSRMEGALRFIGSQHDKAGNWAVEIAKEALADQGGGEGLA